MKHDDVKATNAQKHPDTVTPTETPASPDASAIVFSLAFWNIIRLLKQ